MSDLERLDWDEYAEDCAAHDERHGRAMLAELHRIPTQRGPSDEGSIR